MEITVHPESAPTILIETDLIEKVLVTNPNLIEKKARVAHSEIVRIFRKEDARTEDPLATDLNSIENQLKDLASQTERKEKAVHSEIVPVLRKEDAPIEDLLATDLNLTENQLKDLALQIEISLFLRKSLKKFGLEGLN